VADEAWTRLASGRPLAAVNSVIYWISNPIWADAATEPVTGAPAPAGGPGPAAP
jgi:hypothetical protein